MTRRLLKFQLDFTCSIFNSRRWTLSLCLTLVIFGVALLQGSDGLVEASVETFDQSDGGGSLSPADRVGVRPRPNRFLQFS